MEKIGFKGIVPALIIGFLLWFSMTDAAVTPAGGKDAFLRFFRENVLFSLVVCCLVCVILVFLYKIIRNDRK